MKTSFTDMLENRVPVIFDGAMGTELARLNLSSDDFRGKAGCNEVLSLTRPDVLRKIHLEYFRAGANVVETNTSGGNRIKLVEYGLADEVLEINRQAARAACEAARDCEGDHPVFVCGSLGPTGSLPSSGDLALGATGFDAIGDAFEEQAQGLLEGGVDLLLLETMQDLLEVRAAVIGIRRAQAAVGREVPLHIQVTMDAKGHMLLGSGLDAFLGAVAGLLPTVVGLNCSTGSHEMAPLVKSLLNTSPLPVSMLPNAGMPQNIDGKAVYTMDPVSFAAPFGELVGSRGLSVVGGCCGTGTAHIRELARVLRGKRVASRDSEGQRRAFLGAGISGVELEAAPKPIIIGERLNAQGSRRTKELLVAGNWDELYQIAEGQVEANAGLLDLCVAVNELPSERDSMVALVRLLAQRVRVPLSIDSTEPEVIGEAMRVCPGSVLVNSINLEHGEQKARTVLKLAVAFGCPVIALTIDEDGMAQTVEGKLVCALRLRDLALEMGLPEHHLYIDPLVFTLATGDPQSADAARTSLEALRRIKEELSGVRTVMGVSNVSYGLMPRARRVLNNLMLHYAVGTGLDAAIFNPLHVDDVGAYHKVMRTAGEDLLLNRSPKALEEFVSLFAHGKEEAKPKSSRKGKATKKIALDKQLYAKVIDRDKRGLTAMIGELLKQRPAESVLNEILLPAMAEVGERMARGEMILPFVLQAAEVMREAVSILEPHLKAAESAPRGTIVLATVFGDVHDIGKNLVGSILRNQGFRVVDLGKQVRLESIVEAVRKENPDAVGLSALLVTTSREMTQCVKEFARLGFALPILVGGAAVNRSFAQRIALLDDGSQYPGGVYYAKDAFEATRVLSDIRQGKKVVGSSTHQAKGAIPPEPQTQPGGNGFDVVEGHDVVVPIYYGTSELLRWDAETVMGWIDEDRLFKGHWKGGSLKAEDYLRTRKEEFQGKLGQVREEIRERDLLSCRAIYGFFPVITDDEMVILLDPSDFHTELASLRFPRIKVRSIADYLRGEGDVVGIQVVTLGEKIDAHCQEYFSKEDRYSLGFYLHALGSYLTEKLAEKVSSEIRRGLGASPGQGKRYSLGYRGLPGVEEQGKLFEILGVEERLGITLTSAFQMVPEHSTMGLFVHHPQARYF